MARHGEYAMLIAAANAALVRTMDDGDAHGYDGQWLNQSPLEHLRHAIEHTNNLYASGDDNGEHIDHAITRLIMLKIVRDADGLRGH